MHFEESSQSTKWQLSSQIELNSLRERANRRARDVLSRDADGSAATDGIDGDIKMEDATTKEGGDSQSAAAADTPDDGVYGFSNTRGERPKLTDADDAIIDAQHNLLLQESDPNYGPTHASKSRGNHPLLTPAEESLLISFYCSKIPLLIGPHAMIRPCRRDAKVASTACLLFRRFYLSNSVMMHDPKSMLAAATFLATKVEDCMISIVYLEAGTKEMSAPVLTNEILDAEVKFIKGIDFDLMVFSPYKTVLSYTEDLRTFLKSEKGRGLITFSGQEKDGDERQLSGQDLRPMHDAAVKICDDVIVSDILMLFAPGEIGLAALMIANEYVGSGGDTSASGDDGEGVPQIDIMGYIRSRFQDSNESEVKVDETALNAVTHRVSKLGQMIRELKDGKHGCGNHHVDMDALKATNKKLKKCRVWGASEKKKEGKKKKKKRKAEDAA